MRTYVRTSSELPSWLASRSLTCDRTSEAALVFISSAVAYAAAPGWGVYAATKAGVHALARSLPAELEPQGIKVFDVAPPIVDTGPAAGLAVPKVSVERVVEDVLAGLRDDRREIRIGRARALVSWHGSRLGVPTRRWLGRSAAAPDRDRAMRS